MSVDRLTEAGVTLAETWLAPMAVDPREEAELVELDKIAFKNGSVEQVMTEGVEISFSELPGECCEEDRELAIDQIAGYSGTHEQFIN